MTSYALRIKFQSDVFSISHDEKVLEILMPGGKVAQLKAFDAEKLSEAHHLLMKVRGFEDEVVALAFGARIKNAIHYCGVKLKTGFNVPAAAPMGGISDYAKNLLKLKAEYAHITFRNDMYGLLVYEDSDPEPVFVSVTGKIGAKYDKNAFIELFQESFDLVQQVSDVQGLSLEMYNLSHMEASPRAKFLTLVTAVECLARPRRLQNDIPLFVDRLIAIAKNDKALNDERDREAFLSRLRFLKDESIAQACERLLGNTCAVQFKKWYKVRCKMVHTGETPGSFSIESELADLDAMVSEMLVKAIGRVSPP